MSQHFLLSPAAKTLSLAQVFRMSDEQAEAMFCKVRWPDTNGEPVCPNCGGLTPTTAAGRMVPPVPLQGVPQGFHHHGRHPIRLAQDAAASSYLAAIAIFCNEVKGKSMLALSRDLGVSYKTAFVLAHKLREAMAVELKGRTIGGNGKIAEVDRATSAATSSRPTGARTAPTGASLRTSPASARPSS